MSLVVDACVLRSASESGKPLPSMCRAVLEAVKLSAITVSVDDILLDEWRRHRSKYSQSWIVAMYSRRLIERVSSFSGKINSVQGAVLSLSEPQRSIASKDIHLIKLAVDRDYRVVSCELSCRVAFCAASRFCNEIGRIVWIIPTYPNAVEVVVRRELPPKGWLLLNP